MFLDPDPRRQRNSGSGFFSSQKPIESPRDRSATPKRRHHPLAERSASEINQQTSNTTTASSLAPTVRLVKPSPDPSAHPGRHDRENHDFWKSREKLHTRPDAEQSRSSPTDIISPTLLGSALREPGQESRVSDTLPPANEAPFPKSTRGDHLFPRAVANVHPPSTPWHRRSASSSGISSISTLQEGDSGFGGKSWRTDSRTSQNTTLRGTPTPTELDVHERLGIGEDLRPPSTHTLHSVEETSPEVSTVRLVSSPPPSSPDSADTPVPRPNTSPVLTPRALRRSSSTSSLPEQNIEIFASSPSLPRHQQSQESIAQSYTSDPETSSPNVIAYYSDSSPPRSQLHNLYAATSIESIQSRLHSAAAPRPDTARSAATNTSWSSRPASLDELPPLFIPKKRLRHQVGSSSLNAAAAASASVGSVQEAAMDEDEYDALPYPRQIFNTHLSTIASESEVHSRGASQQLSHFSLGSGVLTGDDASEAVRIESWPPLEENSQDYGMSAPSSPWATASSVAEPSDMALARYRDESAMPPPLFHSRSPSAPPSRSTFETKPLPPVPPIPRSRDSEEHFGHLPELAPPQLREQRSGYSLRRRSHSTPSRGNSRALSMISISSRYSQGPNTFPTWARAYYAQGATLMSASQVSLSAPSETPPLSRYMIARDWSDYSTISRAISEASDPEASSPVSSRFLPSIFRPRTRRIASGEGRSRRSRVSRPSPPGSVSRPDSMIITPLPPPRNPSRLAPIEQAQYGNLKDHSSPEQPLPRRYSKQRNWDRMDFPRPMTKDETTDVEAQTPRLFPNRRLGQRVSAWHAPSFAESLDSLLKSRCNRQILFFALGFLCPIFWWTAAVLALPKRPMTASDFEKAHATSGSQDDIRAAMMKHEAGDAEKRWREERQWLKARWWRYLNRIMSIIGVLVMSAVISLAVVATQT